MAGDGRSGLTLRAAVAVLCLLVQLVGRGAHALYFHIGETEKRCFIEEIPDETMVIGNYRTQLWDKQTETFLPSTPGLGMFVEVKDPDKKVVLSRQYGSEGRFTFTSHTHGEHQICLHSNSTRMALFSGGKLRVHLDIQVGEHTNNYPEIAAKDKLTELQLRARQLLDQVEQIQKEQNYQRYREERFRMTSESTNQRVLWWSIAQTIILILTGVWQMRHLKSFFEAKKLEQMFLNYTFPDAMPSTHLLPSTENALLLYPSISSTRFGRSLFWVDNKCWWWDSRFSCPPCEAPLNGGKVHSCEGAG